MISASLLLTEKDKNVPTLSSFTKIIFLKKNSVHGLVLKAGVLVQAKESDIQFLSFGCKTVWQVFGVMC